MDKSLAHGLGRRLMKDILADARNFHARLLDETSKRRAKSFASLTRKVASMVKRIGGLSILELRTKARARCPHRLEVIGALQIAEDPYEEMAVEVCHVRLTFARRAMNTPVSEPFMVLTVHALSRMFQRDDTLDSQLILNRIRSVSQLAVGMAAAYRYLGLAQWAIPYRDGLLVGSVDTEGRLVAKTYLTKRSARMERLFLALSKWARDLDEAERLGWVLGEPSVWAGHLAHLKDLLEDPDYAWLNEPYVAGRDVVGEHFARARAAAEKNAPSPLRRSNSGATPEA